MGNDKVTRRAALGGIVGAAVVQPVAAAQLARGPMEDRTEVKRIFVDLRLADAELATSKGQLFQLVDSTAGTSAVFRRSAAGSEKLYDDVTSSSLGGSDGSAKIGFDGDTVAMRLNILSATMRPAMRGIFSAREDQRAALLDFIHEAAKGGKTIEWGPIDVSLDVVTQTNNRRGLLVPTGSRWVMHPDTRFRALPNDASHYEIINIMDSEDISIEGNGARLIGERNAHTGEAGQWGFGVSIRGARNIRIKDLIAEDCWGDGFYIGSGRQKYCQDIILKNTKSIRARRNGLSLISARGLLCEDHESNETNGHAPQWGVDIEPNSPDEYLEDITFLRTITRDSARNGFGMHLNSLSGTKNPVSIRLIDCVDRRSASGFHVGSARNTPGRIDIIRAESVNARRNGITIRRKAISGPTVCIEKPIVIDWNRNGPGAVAAQAGICIFSPGNDSGAEALGGVDIINPEIVLNSGISSAAIFVVDQRRGVPPLIRDVRVIDPIALAGQRCWFHGENITLSDKHRVSERVLADASMGLDTSAIFYHNIIDVTGIRNYDISPAISIGTEFIFEVASSGPEGRICFPEGSQLYPDNVSTNRYIGSGVKGSRLKIRKIADGEWTVIERIGTWATG